jgi:hypothetical protein
LFSIDSSALAIESCVPLGVSNTTAEATANPENRFLAECQCSFTSIAFNADYYFRGGF